MKKKVLAIVVAVVLALGCTTFLAACGKKKGKVDTFEGVISEKTYDSSENAVKGFLTEELNSDYLPATYVSHEKDSDVDVNKLTLTEADKTNIESAEKFKVKFTKIRSYGSYEAEPAPTTPKTYENKVTVIKLTDGKYKFYTALPENGEVVTNSYLKSITDCKSVSMEMTYEIRYPEMSMGPDSSTPTIGEITIEKSTSKIKYGETAHYEFYRDEVFDKDNKSKGYEEETAYTTFKDGFVWTMRKGKAKEGNEEEETDEYAEKEEKYSNGDYSEYTSFADYLKDNSVIQKAKRFLNWEYTIYIKTDYGMTVETDSADIMDGMTVTKNEYRVEVKNGKLSKIIQESRGTMQGVDGELYNKQTITVFDIDSTTVEVPADFLALIDKEAE